MALTFDNSRVDSTPEGKVMNVRAQFDASYPTNGEAVDPTSGTVPFSDYGDFTTVRQILCDSPKTSTGAPSAVTVATRCVHDPAAGTLVLYREAATGEEAEVPNTTDVSAVYVNLRIVGT